MPSQEECTLALIVNHLRETEKMKRRHIFSAAGKEALVACGGDASGGSECFDAGGSVPSRPGSEARGRVPACSAPPCAGISARRG
eukprot:scaffold18064_cov18-Prasinocladus_malaysianus.AAC.1